MNVNTPVARFRLGRIVATANAAAQLAPDDILIGIGRHQAGDWGDVDAHDRAANEKAIIHGTRILSVFQSRNRVKFWIITEADQSYTTILLPEDY
ncbi:MAG TPA: hypothetical protein VFW05_00705 [Verrucomicrobiae bacterium]|nr:hypothetical protein [Verrucomicrobiae bacterium]